VWREWSRTQKTVVAVAVFLAAWFALGTVVTFSEAVSSNAAAGNAFAPLHYCFGVGWVSGSCPSVTSSNCNLGFLCNLLSPQAFAAYVYGLFATFIVDSAGLIWGAIQNFLQTFIVGLFQGVLSWALNGFNAILSTIAGAIESVVSTVGSVLNGIFQTLTSWSVPFGPLAPIVVVTASLLFILIGGIALYFLLILLFATFKTLFNLL
jgi:hypothetical protein